MAGRSLNYSANLSFLFLECPCLLDRYNLAKKCGFKAVECAFPYVHNVNDIKHVKEKCDLKQVLINTHPGDSTKNELGLAAIPGKQDDFNNSLKLSVEYAKILDCTNIHIMAGIVKNPNSENDQVYIENLKHACEILENEGMIGLIEPINQRSLPDYYLTDFDKAIDIIDKVGKKNLKLQLDIFHLQRIKGDLTHNIKRYLPYCGHIQIAQVPNRDEPNTPGEINYDYIFNLLKEENYTQWIGLEYKPALNTESGLGWLTL